jgi:thiosulfate/3-mercaptopyruvate sulfurtransferase
MGYTRFLAVAAFVALVFGDYLRPQENHDDPWTPAQLITPEALAKELAPGAKWPVIISVAFPVLYRNRHIETALFAGPGRDPEGIAALKAALKDLPKDAEIVVYCGCCPMEHCPNLRPAFRTLKELGYTRIHALNIPANFNADWVSKGYPVSPPLASKDASSER